jgi:hypothetical protein
MALKLDPNNYKKMKKTFKLNIMRGEGSFQLEDIP